MDAAATGSGAWRAGTAAGGSVDEYTKLAQVLRYCEEVSAVEVNISCPNVEDRGQVFACDARSASDVIASVRRFIPTGVPVIAKLSPDVTDIVAIAHAVVRAGADALSLVNTTLGMVIDTETLRPALAGVTGGLSGPAIRPVAVRCVWQVHAAMPDVPIIGIGGIGSGLDALQFVLAGASAVQVGTATFWNPRAPLRIAEELGEFLKQEKKYWLVPIVIVFVLFGLLIVFSQSSAVAPFIYTLF